MFTVYCDDKCIYDTTIDGLMLQDPTLDTATNDPGSFSFTIYPQHPYYNMINKMTSVISVYYKGKVVFRGRPIIISRGSYNQKDVTCEGDLAYLLDTIQMPYDYMTGDKHTTIKSLFSKFIDDHNSQVEERKRFTVGRVTVTDSNDYIVRKSSDYVTTWKSINDKLIDMLGGYIMTRYEDGETYIDYLAEINTISNQDVEFGKNLLSISVENKFDDIYTAILPLGARIESDEDNSEEKRLTISDINDGVAYIEDAEAVKKYGFICTVETFEDITIAENLLKAAKERLAELCELQSEITLTAADLSGTGINVNPFMLGRWVNVYSLPHGVSGKMLINKMHVSLNNPTSNTLTLGKTAKALSDFTSKAESANSNLVKRVEKVESNAKINEGAVAEVRDIVNEANTKSDEANQKADDANAKVDGLVYDNRNYVLGSGNYVEGGETGWTHASESTKDYIDISTYDGYTRISIKKMGSATSPRVFLKLSDLFKKNVRYTISFKVRMSSARPLKIKCGAGNVTSTISNYASNQFTANEWVELSNTFKVLNSATDYYRIGLAYDSFSDVDDYIDFEWLKIEEGEKATPWSPAPEDDVNNLRDDTNAAIIALKEEVGSQIDQSAESVKTTVYENVYVKDEVDSLVSSVSTEVEQTKDSWQITFNQFQADVDDIANGNDAKFEEIKKYIRFEDGNIILGNSESPLVLKIQNDRIQFLQNGYEVAYISDRKMYNTICSVIDRLEIGDSAWQVEHNEDGDTVVSLVPIY